MQEQGSEWLDDSVDSGRGAGLTVGRGDEPSVATSGGGRTGPGKERMRGPNFFIIGAPKCGTTSMYRYLSAHPSVYMPALKEPHYFATDLPNRRYVKTEGDYLALFSGATDEHLAVGEASVWYLYSREAPSKIRQFYAEARLIVFFRNPVDFVQSLHDQFAYDQGRDPDFSEAWRKNSDRLLEFGSFGAQFQRLLTVFPREQILVVLFDDLLADPRVEYERVLRHLGISDDGRTVFPAHNARKLHRSGWLADFIMHTPDPLARAWRGLKKATGVRHVGVLDRLSRLNTKVAPRPRIDSRLRTETRRAFTQDIELLASLIQRDLSHWL